MRIRLNLKIFIFMAIFIFTKQIKIYGLLMLFAFIHEFGHMIAGIILGFRPYSLEIMPAGISISFKVKEENYNKKVKNATVLTFKKIIIAANGPLTNIILIMLFILKKFNLEDSLRELIVYSNIIIAIFNLLPIYPLDGGRILKGILYIFYGRRNSYIYINKISNLCVIILTAMCSIVILFFRNVAILLTLTYLWYLVINENKKFKSKEQIYIKLSEISNEKKQVIKVAR